MTNRIRLSYRGVGEMLSSQGMENEMLRRAKKVRDRAEATAPVSTGPDDEHRGRYKNSFTASSGVQRRRTKRAVGRVTSSDPAAFQIEFGTRRSRKYRTLGKALDAARD